jgi:hypothetical protein
MELSSLFALPDGLEVAETSVTGSVLTLSLVATALLLYAHVVTM